jgi:mannosyltransferase
MFQLLRNRIWLFPWMLVLLNVVLKFLYVSFNNIALDEPFSIFYAQWKLGPMIQFLFSGNNPPLFEILLHFWVRLFGTGSFAVRFLPVLFSSLTALYVYLIGKKIFGALMGMTASILFTFSSFNMYFAHEARVYSLFTLLSTASIYYYFSLEDKSSRRYFLSFIGCNVLLAFSHYFGMLVILAELFFSLFFLRRHPFSFRKIWISFILELALISPLLAVLPSRLMDVLHSGGTWVTKPPLDAWYENIRKFSNQPVVAVLFLLMIAGGTFVMVRKGHFKNHLEVKVLTYWFFGIYTLLFLLSFLLPVFLDRYLVFLSVPFYLLVGAGAGALGNKLKARIVLSAVCCIAMICTVNLHPGNGREPAEMTAFIRSKQMPHSVVFIAPAWADKGLMYYCDRSVFEDAARFEQRMEAGNWFSVYSPAEAALKIPEGTTEIIYVEQGKSVSEISPSSFFSASSPYVFKEQKQFDKVDRVSVFELKQGVIP